MQKITKETPIAVVGVSENSEKYGHKIFRDLVEAGYTVSGVNPKGGSVLGRELYTALADIKPQPELIVSVIPPKNGLSVLKDAHELGITNVWLQPGAESETLVNLAEELSIALTTNACFMIKEGVW